MHLKKISRELRRHLFGRSRRSNSPGRHRGYDERPHGGRGSGRRDDDRDRHQERSRRPRSRSRSLPGRRNGSPPARESSAERRAKIEQSNREREQTETGNRDGQNLNNDQNSIGDAKNGGHHDDDGQLRSAISALLTAFGSSGFGVYLQNLFAGLEY